MGESTGNTVPRGLVLSLFPGADLLGRAFEALGWCVVRGPDILWGGDISTFHVPPGVFDVVIGGPPCQVHSRAARNGTSAVDKIPEYRRVVAEAKPKVAVMENVTDASADMPGWHRTVVRDWDCGGLTNRTRAFWVMGAPPLSAPPRRSGRAALSVLASCWRGRTGKNGGTPSTHQKLSASEAARLQGYPGLHELIIEAQPGGPRRKSGAYVGVSESSRRCLAIHMLGNGVPKAMADYVAQHVTAYAEVRHG